MFCFKLKAKEAGTINGIKNIIRALTACAVTAALMTAGAAADGGGHFSMTYLYGGYDYDELIGRADGAIDEVAPGWFDISGDGELKLVGADREFVERMHGRGITVTPFISNHWDRAAGRAALENTEALTSELAAAAEEYGLDGINVDIENLTERDSGALLEFTRLLREKLGADKTVSVAVAANPRGFTSGWHASYDYAGLAGYADYLVIMAYDEHYEGGEAGPTAGLPFVEESVRCALKYTEADRLVLAVPFYGRYWKQGESRGGFGAPLSGIERIIERYGGTVSYDGVNASPSAVVEIGRQDEKPELAGRVLSEGTYTFWYENKDSMCRKLELADKYGLLGAGSWSLGQEDDRLWSYYVQALNPATEFDDVRAYDWFYPDAHKAVDAGYMTARAGAFRPADKMTRGELVQALYSMAQSPPPQGECAFTDIDENSPLCDALAWMNENGIARGRDDGAFYPDEAVTRQDAAVMLFRYAASGGENTPCEVPHTFCDADEVSGYASAAVCWAAEAGILNGTPQARLMPRENTTRAQAAAMLMRLPPRASAENPDGGATPP